MAVRRLVAGFVVVLAGCLGDAQSAFTADRVLEACNATIPVCTTTAACVLGEGNYAQGSFAQGATRRFIVRTTAEATVEVAVYFASESSPGVDTEIAWYEVGCRDRHSAASDGQDVFAEAGADRVWRRSQRLVTAGDHLVEVFSDAQADYLVRISLQSAQ